GRAPAHRAPRPLARRRRLAPPLRRAARRLPRRQHAVPHAEGLRRLPRLHRRLRRRPPLRRHELLPPPLLLLPRTPPQARLDALRARRGVAGTRRLSQSNSEYELARGGTEGVASRVKAARVERP